MESLNLGVICNTHIYIKYNELEKFSPKEILAHKINSEIDVGKQNLVRIDAKRPCLPNSEN